MTQSRLREVMWGGLTMKYTHTENKKATSASPTALLHTQPAADVLIRNVKQQGRKNDMVSAFFSSSYLKVRVASACRWANFPFFPLCQAELGLSITRADQTGGKGLSGGIPQIMRLMCLFFMFVQCHYHYERPELLLWLLCCNYCHSCKGGGRLCNSLE